ncbi:MAG: motility protein MotB, partial [Betaproteobacteria bacterium]|nr:motility protein MotB [Betaproteobacteria bacterium]
MAAPDKNKPTIVIKRIKKGGHGHHGGAWKIAYADFVTAMMAFFLLMWLLGSTTQGDLKGIADYFNNPMKV